MKREDLLRSRLREIEAEEYRLSTEGMSVGIGYAHTSGQLDELADEKRRILRELGEEPVEDPSRRHGRGRGAGGWWLLIGAVVVIVGVIAALSLF